MSSTGKDKVKPSGEGRGGESKDKGQHERGGRDTAESGKVIFAERSDSLVGPNWITVITNMLCLYVRVCMYECRGIPQQHGKACMDCDMYVCRHLCLCVSEHFPSPKAFSSGSHPTIFSHRDLINTPACSEGAGTETLISGRATQTE